MILYMFDTVGHKAIEVGENFRLRGQGKALESMEYTLSYNIPGSRH